MLSPEDYKIQRNFLLGALVIGLVFISIDFTTGFFTHLHLSNEESLAIRQGADSDIFKQMVDELIGDSHSHITWMRIIAAVELGHLGTDAAKAIPDLEQLLNGEQKDVRTEAAFALAKMGSRSPTTVNALIELLQQPNDHEKYLAAKALGLIGPDAKKAIPLLQKELQNGHTKVKKAITEALEKIIRDEVAAPGI